MLEQINHIMKGTQIGLLLLLSALLFYLSDLLSVFAWHTLFSLTSTKGHANQQRLTSLNFSLSPGANSHVSSSCSPGWDFSEVVQRPFV